MYSLPLERREYLTALFFLPLSSWGLWILAGIGVSFTWRAPERLGLAWPLLALIGVHIVVLMAFFVSTRLKMPLMFFLTPFAGLAVVELWRGREPRTGRLIIVATVAVLLLTSVHWLFFTRPSLQDELRLVSVLSRQSRLDEALSLLDPWVRESDPDPLAVDHAGWIWSKKGELVQAQSHYLRALEIGLPSPSREAQTHSRLASVSEQLGQVEIAATHHDAAVSVAPDSAGARHERALFLLRRGMTERGVADLREAVRMAPGWEDPRRTLRSLGINPDALPEDRVSPPW
jgi:tetratricopeptide (TPR) repeat protein